MLHSMPLGVASFLSGYNIANAALFDGSTGYLSWTPASAGNRKKWTFSAFVQWGDVATQQYLFSATYGANSDSIRYNANSVLDLFGNGAIDWRLTTSSVYRDPTSFGMLTVSMDTAQATGSDRLNVYWGADLIASYSTETYPALNRDGGINDAVLHAIGQWASGSYYSGYLAEVRFIDGQALTPSDFGEVSTITGNWIAKKYTDAYGTNGFHLDFSNGADLGEDQSGNNNDWTVNGTITQVTSTPTDVVSTMDPSHFPPNGPTGELSNGNLTVKESSVGFWGYLSTIKSGGEGKWGFKVTIDTNLSGSVDIALGLQGDDTDWLAGYQSNATGVALRGYDGAVLVDNVVKYNPSTAPSATDYFEFLWDEDTGDLTLKKNGAAYYSGSAVMQTGIRYLVYTSNYGGAQVTFDFGQNGYTPSDSAYSILSTNNLPAMTATDKNVNSHFNTVSYLGDGVAIGSGGNAITGVGFQPDFVWIKNRDTASTPNMIYDAIRGVTKTIRSDTTGAESTDTETLNSFDEDGFTVGSQGNVNNLNDNHVAWCANLPTSQGNTDGSITVSAGNQRVGGPGFEMSATVFTSTGNVDTVGHGLSKPPKVCIFKNLDSAQSWAVYHADLGPSSKLNLNTTSAAIAVGTASWNSTDPTSTVVTLGNADSQINNGTDRILMLCFAECDFIKIGKYTGNGNADGVNIAENLSTVFRLHKGNAAGYDWGVYDSVRDTYNPAERRLYPNTANAEFTGGAYMDFTATGMKHRDTNANVNGSGIEYLYLLIGQPTGASNADEVTGQ